MKRRLTKDAFKLHSITICMLNGKACSNDCRKCDDAIKRHEELKEEAKKP